MLINDKNTVYLPESWALLLAAAALVLSTTLVSSFSIMTAVQQSTLVIEPNAAIANGQNNQCSSNETMVLYTNIANAGTYKYPREYQTDVKYEKRTIIIKDQPFTLTITGIPDGVSPVANEAIIHKGTRTRLYIFSDKPLSDESLQSIDALYGREPYPIFYARIVRQHLPTYPNNNFYLCQGPPSNISEFVEYRYLQQRHQISTIAYDNESGSVYQLVLPKRPMLVIIMPENFVRTTLRSGYFRFNNNIIVRVFSQYLLASTLIDSQDDGAVTSFTTDNDKVSSIVESFFSRLGINKISSNSPNHIYGYDKYVTLVVGSISNIVL